MLMQRKDCKETSKLVSKQILRGFLMSGLLFSGGYIYPAYSQNPDSRDMIALQNEVAQLRSQMNQLQAQSNSSGSDHRSKKSSSNDNVNNNGLLTELVTRVSNLEDQQRTMRGELDDLQNQVRTKMAALDKKIDDMNFAAGRGGSSGDTTAAVSSGATAASAAATPSHQSDTGSGGRTLKDGQNALLAGNYQESEAIARDVLNTPQGKKTVNAYFLLAQSLAGQKRYKDASLSYFDIYKKFPNSPRAPQSLLGVSITMLKNGDSKSACQAIQLLNSKYPNATAQVKKASSDLSKKAKCS